jgi:hypothetical protein
MSEDLDLKEIEKKAWRSTFEDGIFEIYFGILYLSLTLGVVLDAVLPSPYNIILIFSVIGLGLTFFLIGKKYISQPRLGKVKFGRTRIARKAKTIAVLIVNFFVLLFILILIPQFGDDMPEFLYGLVMGLLFFTIPLSFVAYFLQFNRLYFIAILVGLTYFLDEIYALLHIPEPFDSLLAYGMVSATIIIIGIIVFIKFLKSYPLPKEEVP